MKFLNLTQNTQEWEQFRQQKIGASDAPIIMEISPWKTPFQLWLEKTGQSTSAQNHHMMRGHNLEKTARAVFENTTNLIVFPRVVQSVEHEWMIASLDGIDMDGKIIVEIKCAGEVDHALAKQGKMPEKYYPQLQHQLAVTGLSKGYYYSFDGTEGVIVEVEKNHEYITKLVETEKKFLECMQTLSAPPLTTKDYNFRDDLAWNERAQKWLQTKQDLENIEQEEKILRNELIELANNRNSQGGGIRLTLSTRKGTVDYRTIPCLKEMDLEMYRKPSSKVWSLSAI
ncbi:MAG: YqaJ viral recombinase family protein [Verrucomicrobia bacterium]|nr:YqaJ viral recombinase family protein [Verrucomicrobiota bacterium]